MKVFMGIDSGTQSTKVIVYDPDRKAIIAQNSAPHNLITDETGKSEQEASWWIKSLKSAMRNIPVDIRKSINAVGISGQQHGFVPVDSDGRVLSPVKLWNDTTTVLECDQITREYGGEKKLLQEVGNLILPGYTASKILWFRKNRPNDYQQMEIIQLPHDYLNYYLTGNFTMECGDASGTGLLNIKTREWDKNLLRILDPERDLHSCFPSLRESILPSGLLSEKAAEELGLTPGIIISSGGGDNMMGAIGTGTNVEGSLTMSLGTSGTLYGYSDTPVIDPEGNLAAFCSSTGGWLPLLCTMNCTVATEKIRSLFNLDLGQMEKLVEKSRPGAEGIITLPFFSGERIPNLPNGKAAFIGLDLVNFNSGNLLRSAMESALFGLKLGLESFVSLGYPIKEIKLIGGGAKSKIWRQMAADIFNLSILVPSYDEAAALGAALQALWCYLNNKGENIELNSILSEYVVFDQDKYHEPHDSEVDCYSHVYEQYRKNLNAVSPLFQ